MKYVGFKRKMPLVLGMRLKRFFINFVIVFYTKSLYLYYRTNKRGLTLQNNLVLFGWGMLVVRRQPLFGPRHIT